MSSFNYFSKVAQNALAIDVRNLDMLADIIADKVAEGGKVMFIGNGGSAADAQHLAAELIGRYKLDRLPIAGLALTTDTSVLTAVANDYSFKGIFTRQLMALGKPRDVLIALSTSGTSPNIVAAIELANAMGIITIGMTGEAGTWMREICDGCIMVPSREANHIQEMHIAAGHYLCGVIEQRVKDFRGPHLTAGVKADLVGATETSEQ